MIDGAIVVFFGGVSGENEISVMTGTMTCNVLSNRGENVLPVYITQDGAFHAGGDLADIKEYKNGALPRSESAAFSPKSVHILSPRGRIKRTLKVRCAINCCHGGWGEGGGISGLCDCFDIPLASASSFESALFINKYLTKIALKGLGVRTLPFTLVKNVDEELDCEFPVMVKPSTLGSSIGVVRADDEEGLKSALSAAFDLDVYVIIDRCVKDRREINCSAYRTGDEIIISPCEEVMSGGAILSYDDKYSGGGERVFPANLDEEISGEIRKTTRYVYEALGVNGIVRFDYILEGDTVWLSEVNTVPGSLSYYLLSTGWNAFYDILMSLVDDAEKRKTRERQKLVINTGIINNFVSNSCKIGGNIVK